MSVEMPQKFFRKFLDLADHDVFVIDFGSLALNLYPAFGERYVLFSVPPC